MKSNLLTQVNDSSKKHKQTPVFVLVAAFAYIIRGYEYLLSPQLFAEDGSVWLADGFNTGLKTIAAPYNGFFHTAERLFGFFVALLPLQFAPLIFNLTALLLFCLTVYYLFTPRTQILGNTYERVFMLLAICLIANIDEFFFNFSNSIFLLGIVGVLILIALPPKNRAVGVLEKALFTLSCFTLPFAWFYLPIILMERLKYRTKTPFYFCMAVSGSIAQLAAYLLSHASRSSVTLLSMFSKYLPLEIYNQIIIPALRFVRIDADFDIDGRYLLLRIGFVIVTCMAMTVVVLKKSNKQVWYLLFFFAIMTLASLKSPLVEQNINASETIKVMSTNCWGDRYFVFGIFATTLVFVKFTRLLIRPNFQYVFIAVYIGFGLVTAVQFRYLRIDRYLADASSQYYSNIRLLQSHTVESVTIPINPSGWYMTLKRK